MKFVAILSDVNIENKEYPICAVISKENESYFNFEKRIQKLRDSYANKSYPPRKGIIDAKTGEEIPLDKQKLQKIYECVIYYIVNVVEDI